MSEPLTIGLPDGREIGCAEWGDSAGSPVFMLHGTPGCRLNRPPEDGRLRQNRVRLITYDRPGYGASTRHPGRAVVDCVGDVAALADALGVERFAVVGGSGGGPHALALSARLPDRVIRAHCVVGLAPYDAEGLDWTAGMDPENVKEMGWALAGEARLTTELTREAAEAQARIAQDPSTLLDGFELPAADVAMLTDTRVQQVIRESSAEMFAAGPHGWVDDDLAFVEPWGFDVAEISVPVEVRYGVDDVLVPAAHGAWLAAHIPGADVVVETGKGHISHPDEMIEHLRRLAHG